MSDGGKLDRWVQDTAELLGEVESVSLGPDRGTDDHATIEQLVRQQQASRSSPGHPPDRDGYFALTVAEDKMSASATFYPPVGSGTPIRVDAIAVHLAERGIVSGVDEDAIRQAVWHCNSEQKDISNVVIARGHAPVDGKSEHVAIRRSLMAPRNRNTDPQGNEPVDHRALSHFVIVKTGDVIAKQVPARHGKMGDNVYGEALAYQTRKVRSPRPGKNTVENGVYYCATIDGQLVWDTQRFFVDPVLDLADGVDYRTGNIDFPGSVVLHKEVRDGFQIRADGSVYCMKTLDASNVTCGGDLIARSGIIGRNRALLVVGGSVTAKYIENCHLEAKGDVTAETGIVNSNVSSLGEIRTGPRGVIVGGTLHALRGVTATQIGTATGPKTIVHCGTDFEAANRLRWIQEKTMEVAIQLDRIRDHAGKNAGVDGEVEPLRDRLLAAKEQLQDATLALMDRLDPDDSASVRVPGTIYAGAYVEICHVPLQVDHDRKNVSFSLNKEQGAVVIANLRTNKPIK